MGLESWFRRGPAHAAGQALYAAAAAQARRPEFYASMGAPDTAEGRFEIYALHVVLLLHRLRREPEAADTAQALFDAFARALDDTLREMGVSDTSVGKKMRKLGEAVYGRIKAYDAALEALPRRAELEDVLGRTVLAATGADVGAVAAYVERVEQSLKGQLLIDLQAGAVQWPEPGG